MRCQVIKFINVARFHRYSDGCEIITYFSNDMSQQFEISLMYFDVDSQWMDESLDIAQINRFPETGLD